MPEILERTRSRETPCIHGLCLHLKACVCVCVFEVLCFVVLSLRPCVYSQSGDTRISSSDGVRLRNNDTLRDPHLSYYRDQFAPGTVGNAHFAT